MDLHTLMACRHTLQCLAADLLSDIEEMEGIQAKSLVGSKDVHICKERTTAIKKALKNMALPQAPLWKLQYTFCMCAYLSDSVVSWLANTVAGNQMKHWFDGHDSLDGLRTRYEQHLMGKFSKKEKKGARKTVVVTATTPQMFAVQEYLLAHMVVSWD